MKGEEVTALALADDHDLQERVWSEAAEEWQREPRELRAAITSTEIDASRSHLARFVGLDAYEAAGGYVRRDLFSDAENAGYIANPDLLHKLATERLVAARRRSQTKGGAGSKRSRSVTIAKSWPMDGCRHFRVN